MADDVAAVIQGLKKKFKKSKIDKNITYYVTLGETEDLKWTITVGPAKCDVKKGKHTQSADCVLKTSPDLFVKLLDGWEPGVFDIARGKLKTNAPDLLRKLREVFCT